MSSGISNLCISWTSYTCKRCRVNREVDMHIASGPARHQWCTQCWHREHLNLCSTPSCWGIVDYRVAHRCDACKAARERYYQQQLEERELQQQHRQQQQQQGENQMSPQQVEQQAT